MGVSAGDSVGVFVDGGRQPANLETPRDNDERDAGVEHLGGHDVAQVVQPERSQPSSPAAAQESVGDPVRPPRRGAAVITGHEPLRQVSIPSLGGEHRASGFFDPGGAERHTSSGEVHDLPAQPEQLSAAGASERRQHQQGMQVRVAGGDVVEQGAQLLRGWRSKLGGDVDDAMSPLGGVAPHPTQRIACERSPYDSIDAGQGAGRQRSADHPGPRRSDWPRQLTANARARPSAVRWAGSRHDRGARSRSGRERSARHRCGDLRFANHHLSHERKQSLFGEIVAALRPGGVFVNLEVVQCTTAELHEEFNRRIERPGGDPQDILAEVESQLQWMRNAGLTRVDCNWRWRGFALLVGERPSIGQPDRHP